MKKHTILKVGEKFNIFKTHDMDKKDGAILESLEDGQLFISVFLSNITKQERMTLKEVKVTVKLFQDTDYFLLTLMSYADRMQFSLIFDPLKYKGKKKTNLFKSNMLTIAGIESTTNIIQTLRYCNIPRGMYFALMNQYERAKEIESFSDKYNRWVASVYDKYTDQQLWDMAKYVGKLGELAPGE